MEPNDLDDRSYKLWFGIDRSVRYHNHRRRFYEGWNTVTVTVAAVGGSSAVAVFFSTVPDWAAAACAAGVALASALDLAVGTARCANLHADLARRFIGLAQRFAHGRSLGNAEHEEITRRRLEIESSEPPVLRLLDVICHYEVLRALGDERSPPKIPWPRRFLALWLSQLEYVQHMDPAR